MAGCNEISLMLGPFEDGELEPHEMQEVARHLAVCRVCEERLDDYNVIGRELRGLTPAVSLEGFAEAVDARIRKVKRRSLRQVTQPLGKSKERWVSGVALGFFSAIAAILTIILITPYARQYLVHDVSGSKTVKIVTPRERVSSQMAKVMTRPRVQRQQFGTTVWGPDGDSYAVISHLETGIPSVAVWSEPQNDTTVIWLPEQGQ